MTRHGLMIARRAALAALFLLVLLPMSAPEASSPKPTEALVITTKAGDVTFRVETARTPGEHARGLMFRRSLAKDAGMLFMYDGEQVINMWMRNTYIPLDMLFIRADGTIARIAADTEPFSEETISSGSKVTGVLEIGGGRAKEFGIRVGDRVTHEHFDR